jgi:hypothetical protein
MKRQQPQTPKTPSHTIQRIPSPFVEQKRIFSNPTNKPFSRKQFDLIYNIFRGHHNIVKNRIISNFPNYPHVHIPNETQSPLLIFSFCTIEKHGQRGNNSIRENNCKANPADNTKPNRSRKIAMKEQMCSRFWG